MDINISAGVNALITSCTHCSIAAIVSQLTSGSAIMAQPAALLCTSQPTPIALPAGHYVIIVSSGAVGVGCQRLGLKQRPSKLAQKQALAAVGQVHLMRFYEDILNALGLVRCRVTVAGLKGLNG